MMRLYEVTNNTFFDGVPAYFGLLSEAKAAADDAANQTRFDTPVSRLEVCTSKADIVKLANRRGWCRSRTLVYTAKYRKRKSP
jgi:hypothetical protein